MKLRYALLLLLIAGCAAEPFPAEKLPILANPDPNSMRDQFARSLPPRFISDDTVIVEAPFHEKLAILGVLKVDRAAGTFELVALNQLGLKLFHVAGDRTTSTIRFALPPLMEHKDLLLSLAGDIRRMYFDLVPDGDARSRVEPTDVQFGEGNLVYVLGGEPPVLVEKRQDGFFGPVWRARYFQYAPQSGGLYPHGIVMDNYQFHYRIVIRNRDWEIEP